MTTEASLGPTASISPSSVLLSLDDFSSGSTFLSIPQELHAQVRGNWRTEGFVELAFNVIIGAEKVAQSASYVYVVNSLVSGPGPKGATATLQRRSPVVLVTSRGVFSWFYSTSNINLLSQPTGSSRDAELYLGKVSFVPVPEPSSVAMPVSCLLALAALRRRK